MFSHSDLDDVASGVMTENETKVLPERKQNPVCSYCGSKMTSSESCHSFSSLFLIHLLSVGTPQGLKFPTAGQRQLQQLLTTQQRSARTPASCWRRARWSRRAWSPGWRSRWTGTDTPAGHKSPRRSSTAQARCLLPGSSWLHSNQ